MAEKHISLPKPFSSGDVSEWFQRYEICSKANGWKNDRKVLKLSTLLEDEALAVWLEMSEAEQDLYETAKEKMISKMAPLGFVLLDDFHKRKLHPGEALSVYVHDLKKLLSQAMPTLAGAARDQLLLHQLLEGIPNTVSRQIRATGETTDLERVIERARLLMTMEHQEQIATVPENESEVRKLNEKIIELTEQVAALTTRKQVSRCYTCNEGGHVQRDCPYRRRGRGDSRRCYNCGRVGHLERNCRLLPQGNEKGAHVMADRRPRF